MAAVQRFGSIVQVMVRTRRPALHGGTGAALKCESCTIITTLSIRTAGGIRVQLDCWEQPPNSYNQPDLLPAAIPDPV